MPGSPHRFASAVIWAAIAVGMTGCSGSGLDDAFRSLASIEPSASTATDSSEFDGSDLDGGDASLPAAKALPEGDGETYEAAPSEGGPRAGVGASQPATIEADADEGSASSATTAAEAAAVADRVSGDLERGVMVAICDEAVNVAAGTGPTSSAQWVTAIRDRLLRRGFSSDDVRSTLHGMAEIVDLGQVFDQATAAEYAASCH